MASPSPSSSSSSFPSSASPPHPHPNPNPNPPDPTPAATPTVALPPPAAIAPPPPSTRRVPPPCWSVEETLALIDSYQEKWYSLRRGNLKASHWDNVSDAVHRRCHNLPGSSPKTAVQCRHKVEKLRKRYRSEKQRSLRNNPNPRTPPTSSWVFFRKMEAMEVGSLPGAGAGVSSATARSTPRPPSPSEDESSDDVSVEEEEEVDYYDDNRRNYRSAHGLVPNGTGLRFKIPKAVRTKGGASSRVDERPGGYPPSGAGYYSANYGSRFSRGYPGMTRLGGSGMEEMRRRVEKKRSKEREEVATGVAGGDMGDIVAAVRMLGDGFMRMEQMKMDMTREIHNLRMEMELKHTEMILDTQRRIVDAFVTGFAGKKRAKIGTES